MINLITNMSFNCGPPNMYLFVHYIKAMRLWLYIITYYICSQLTPIICSHMSSVVTHILNSLPKTEYVLKYMQHAFVSSVVHHMLHIYCPHFTTCILMSSVTYHIIHIHCSHFTTQARMSSSVGHHTLPIYCPHF